MNISPALLDRLVLTLGHFLWQGSLLALVAWLITEGLGIRSARVRYAGALCLLLTCLALPCVTFFVVEPSDRPILVEAVAIVEEPAGFAFEQIMPISTSADADSLPVVIPGPSQDTFAFPDEAAIATGINLSDSVDTTPAMMIETALETTSQQPALTWLQHNGWWFVLVWSVGVALLTMRLFLATFSAFVLRWRGRPVEVSWQRDVERLSRLMKLRRTPNAKLSRMVRQVCVVGLFRPVILFPASWASGVPAEVLEAVIAHELAHIRRHDVWVIHLQRVVETLLFFHPGVWWMSRQVSRYRELCCDADAAGVLGSPVKYAKALEYVALKDYAGSQSLFMATLGGRKMELLERIQTLLGSEPPRQGRWRGSLAACLVLAGVLTAIASLALPGVETTQADDEPVAAEPMPDEDEQSAGSVSEPFEDSASGIEASNEEPSAEPVDEAEDFDPSEMPQVLARVRAAGITFEPVCEGSPHYRIAGFTGSEEYAELDNDFRHLLVGKLLHEVVVAEELELSLTEFEIGRWHQRRLEADLGYLPDDLEVVELLKIHPQLRRFVLHDGSIEFITPESQCTPEELAAIRAECTTLPIESSFHYDKQLDGVTWRVHGFREKPWLIVVEDVSSPRLAAASANPAEGVDSPRPLTAEETAAMDRLQSAGCRTEVNDDHQFLVVLPQSFDSSVMDDLICLGNRVEVVTLRGQLSPFNEVLTPPVSYLTALSEIRLINGIWPFRQRFQRMSIAADEIVVKIDRDLEGAISTVMAKEGIFAVSRIEGQTSSIRFERLHYDVASSQIRVEGSVRGVGLDGQATIEADGIEIQIVQAPPSGTIEMTEELRSRTFTISHYVARDEDGRLQKQSIDALTQLIRAQAPEESWSGRGEIVYDLETLTLTITQTEENIERIRDFLATLDRLQGIETLEEALFGPDEGDAETTVVVPAASSSTESQILPNPVWPGELAIATALNETTSIHADGIPLSDVMRMISNQHEINIVVDESALQEVGVTSNEPIDLDIEGVTLRSALRIMLEPLELAFRVDGEVLKVTSRHNLEGEMSVRVYPVGDIISQGSDVDGATMQDRINWLAVIITEVVEPGTWSHVGGPGSIDRHGSTLSLIVRQTAAVHQEVADLLEALRGRDEAIVVSLRPGGSAEIENAARIAIVSGHASEIVEVTAVSPSKLRLTGVANGRTSFVLTDEFNDNQRIDIIVSDGEEVTEAMLTAEEQIEQALRRRIEVQLRQKPLAEALRDLSEDLGINIVLDEPGLNEVGVTANQPVTLSLRNIPARTALELLLDPLQLGFAIQDEVVFVTSQQRLEGRLDLVSYDVGDLVDASSDTAQSDLEELGELLLSTVAPDSWESVGGQGSIALVPWRSLLLVRQTSERHEAVRAVLGSIRQARGSGGIPATRR